MVLQMPRLAPPLLLAAPLHHPRRPLDRRAYGRKSAGVDVQHQACERGARGLGRWRAFSPGEVGGEGRGPVRDPVMHEEGDVGVGEQVQRLPRGGVGGHYDAGVVTVRGEGRAGEVGVVHEGDVRV